MQLTKEQIQQLNLTKEELLHIWDLLDEIDSGDNVCQTFNHFISECEHRFGAVPTEYYDDYPTLVYCWTYKGMKYEADDRKLVKNNDEIFQAWSEDLIEQATNCFYGEIKDYIESLIVKRFYSHIPE